MSTTRPNLLVRLRRAVTLRRAISVADAIKLGLRDYIPGEFKTRLRRSGLPFVIRCNTSDSKCLEKIFVYDEYKLPFPATPKLIIDAGANIGLATLYFRIRFPEAKIVAVEPDRTNFELLERDCAGLDNVILIHAALWPEQRPLSVHASEYGKWASWVSEGPPSDKGTEAVKAVTVAEILAEVGAKHVDLLKLDIEGAELELFARNSDDWLGAVRMLVVERHDRFRGGCAQPFYAAISKRSFRQEIFGENIFIQFENT